MEGGKLKFRVPLLHHERVLCPSTHEVLISTNHKKDRCVSRYTAVQRDGAMAGYGRLMHPSQTNKTEALRVTL